MRKHFRRKVVHSLLVLSLAASVSPMAAYGQEAGSGEPAVEAQTEQAPSIEPIKPKITYGPYQGSDREQVHAYEPFKAKDKAEAEKSAMKASRFRDDQILIKLEQDQGGVSAKASSLPLEEIGVVSLEPLFPVQAPKVDGVRAFGAAAEEENQGTWYRAAVNKGTDIIGAVEKLSGREGVLAVEPDYIRVVEALPDEAAPIKTEEAASAEVGAASVRQSSATLPADEMLGEQWYLEKAGVTEAWAHLQEQGMEPGGSRDVVVAVIDTGVDYNHPDLAGNMWVNTGEIAGNGYDDDQNGYVDDIHGATTVGDRWAGESGDPMDDHGHGTHVAGIIAAQANNGGMTGIAYNTQIMAIKAGQSSGIFSSSDIAEAIYYAVEKGADVINMSFGGYGRSTVEEDALQVAFGTSVLVAAAGNDGKPDLPHPLGRDMFPAAYPWVLGVMAELPNPAANGDNLAGFSNWDTKFQDSHEYEIMAPGVEILSTLPNGQYAKWSGTSMAAPVISGIAALLRSEFSDKSDYSSRFIMGQIVSTGAMKQGKTYSLFDPPTEYHEVNALSALTNTPKPELSYLEHYLFDKPEIAEGNDGDGVIDAGETIDLAMVIRNHWGKADQVKVTIDTLGSGGMADPYTTLITDTVEYGAVGNFGTDDNGLIYEDDMVVGVNQPFRIAVSADTPNDHLIPINITFTAKNGFDAADPTDYTSEAQIMLKVRRGVELPGVISEDMTLTKDQYWIVPNATIIEAGATVTVEPGTQIQFWSAEPEDPYAEQSMAYIMVRGQLLVNGTAEEPVEMFASSMFPGFEVKIYSTNNLGIYPEWPIPYRGYAEINYAKIMNPNIAVQEVDHSFFSQDLFGNLYKRNLYEGTVETYSVGPFIHAATISNSRFYQMGISDSGWIYGALHIYGQSKGNLFDSSVYYMNESWAQDNVFLKNFKLNEQQYGDRTYWMSKAKGFAQRRTDRFSPEDYRYNFFQLSSPAKYEYTGSTYFAVYPGAIAPGYDTFKLMQEFADQYGGHLLSINSQEENDFIRNYLQNNYLYGSSLTLGLHDSDEDGIFQWENGDEVTYSNWENGYPINSVESPTSYVLFNSQTGTWQDSENDSNLYIVEIPGVSYVTEITIDRPTLTLEPDGIPFQLTATISPSTAADQTVTWTSSDTTVATVDEYGLVTPLSLGTTIITATTRDGGLTATSEVTVAHLVPAEGIVIDKSSEELLIGTFDTLVATVLPEASTDKRVTWSSSDESVVSVDQSGRVTALKEGSVTITATAEDGGFTATCIVFVVIPATGIKLDKQFLRLVKGNPPTVITPTVEPAAATNKQVKWSSSNTTIVTVDEQGSVYPVGVGTALVTAATDDGGFQASTIVTVWETEVSFSTKQVAAGSSHTLALSDDGTVFSWGANSNGQLGDQTSNNRSTPVQVKDITDVIDIAAGSSHSLALKNDGSVYGWGAGYSGQLGTVYSSYVPMKLNDLTDIVDIAAGSSHTLALRNDGTVWSMGNNNNGQLGDGTTTSWTEPGQVQNLSDVIDIAAAGESSYAIKSDGTVWAWGQNEYGQLGDGSNTRRVVPVQVKNLTNVKEIEAGYYHALALSEDGTVWAWGGGYYGALGNGSSGSYRYTPDLIQGLTNVVSISAGDYYHSLAVKDDGTLWAWGNNEYGKLGNGTTNRLYYPTQIGGIQGVASVSTGYNFSLAIKNDGTIFSWGGNDAGQLGNLSTVDSYTPVQTLFGILPDNEAPQLISTSPVNNETDVAVNTTVTITFNEGIKAGYSFGSINLRDADNKIVSLKSKVIDGTTLQLEPLNNLLPGTTYTVRIPANALSDVFNNNFGSGTDSDYYLTFTTAGSSGVSAAGVNAQAITEDGREYWTWEEIYEIREQFLQSGVLDEILKLAADDYNVTNSTVKNNAILNRWWDPNVNNWMRFTSEEGNGYRYIAGNYWGTTNTDLIEKALIHFNDFRNMEEIIYTPVLTTPPETAYPFVSDLYVSTSTEERATRVGAETINIHVKFNRDMDQSIQPQVSFGPDMPTTDYTVNGVDGGWVDPRHWVGQAKISPITGDGYQFFRVAGAVAGDDPWLVTGNDTERFRFEIITTGTEAMNLQAAGGEGKINLSWSQDDFDLLAGYNIYRSDSGDEGTYTKLNQSIIPAEQKQYEDADVQPGQTYYYKFTVAKTDLSESDFSNVASATALDTVAPTITHYPVIQAAVGLPLQIYADVTDNVKVDKVYLNFRKAGSGSTGTSYTKREMVKTTGNRYSASIEGTLMQAPGIEYYLEATDGISTVKNGYPDSPYVITVNDSPVITSVSPSEGPSAGGTSVTITGSNFKAGASVKFGDAVASDVIVESASRITATTPAHYPATVDVTVANTDGYKNSKLQAFTYKNDVVEVSIPTLSANIGQTIEVPVNVASVTGLRSVDLKLTYDPEFLQIMDVTAGALTGSFSVAMNSQVAGQVSLSMASATAVSGSGKLAVLEFKVLDSDKLSSAVTLEQADLNDGSIPVQKSNGSVTLASTYSVSGYVGYYGSNLPVPGVQITLSGDKNYTGSSDANGLYSIMGIEQGAYIAKAEKGNAEASSITAHDASLILQAAVGLITLSENQRIAADVDNNQKVNAMDAAYVLEKAVNLLQLPFPGAGKVWTFKPGTRNYDSFTYDRSSENWEAILIGDVSGNWSGTSGGGATAVATITSASAGTTAPAPTITIDPVRTLPGMEVIVPVKYSATDTGIYSTDLTITYDPTVATLLAIDKTEQTKNDSLAYSEEVPGTIRIALAGSAPLSGDGILINLKFMTSSTAGQKTAVTLEQVLVNELVAAAASGQIAVSIKGDLDLNNLVDIRDLLIIADLYLQRNQEFDTNGDGVIDLYDFVNVAKYFRNSAAAQ